MNTSKKIVSIILMLSILLSTVIPVYATELSEPEPEPDINEMIFDPNAVSFYGTYDWNAFYAGGTYLYVEATTTASDNQSHEVFITLYLFNSDDEYTLRTYSDGRTKYAGDLPLYGGSSIYVSASCADTSVQITMDLLITSYTPSN